MRSLSRRKALKYLAVGSVGLSLPEVSFWGNQGNYEKGNSIYG